MSTDPPVGVILAAGSATRFGGGKVRALLDGCPVVGHVLASARAAGLQRLVLVLGRDAVAVQAALRASDAGLLEGVLVAINATPERGLASSLRLGLAAAAAGPPPDGVIVLLGDQPRVRAEVIAAVAAAAGRAPRGTIAVAPVYAGDAAPNPVLVLPAAWPLVAALEGDRGLAPILAAHPGGVLRVPVEGSNPDVDTAADLAALEGGRA